MKGPNHFPRFLLRLIIPLLCGWPLLTAVAADPGSPKLTSADLATFEARRRAVLVASAEDGSERFMRAECLFALGRNAEALIEVNKGLDPLVPGNKINRWMHGGNTGLADFFS